MARRKQSAPEELNSLNLTTIMETIESFNAGRDPERLAMKYALMRTDPFAFLRGTAHLFYELLPHHELPKSPSVWLCGDLHLQNFGSFRGDNHLTYFDMNDFDEAALGPALLDLVRLVTSIEMAGVTLNFDYSQSVELCNCFLNAYCGALRSGKARWVERETAGGLVKGLLKSVSDKCQASLLKKRTDTVKKKRYLRLDGRKALAAARSDRDKILSFMDRFARTQPDPAFFEVLDVARRIAGNGSLGVERYVILVRGDGTSRGAHLLDIKEARPTSLAPHIQGAQPGWKNEAERVVSVQKFVQAISPAFLNAVTIGPDSYILKDLQPIESRVDLDRWNGKINRLIHVLETMGEVVAWGQLRSSGRLGSASVDELMAFAEDSSWQSPLLDVAARMIKIHEELWKHFTSQ